MGKLIIVADNRWGSVVGPGVDHASPFFLSLRFYSFSSFRPAQPAAAGPASGARYGLSPLFCQLQHKPVLIVGGGEVAVRKARLLLDAKARVTINAPISSTS